MEAILKPQLKKSRCCRWKPFDPSRNIPDLGPRFSAGEKIARATLRREKLKAAMLAQQQQTQLARGTNKAAAAAASAAVVDDVLVEVEADDDRDDEEDKTDLDWSTVIKRTFEAYIRGERPNMYGEWLVW